MTKEFVPYELALALKEKGFDEICSSGYIETDFDKEVKLKKGKDCKNSDKIYGMFCTAPTISDVVMWLYEKNGLWVVVNIDKPHLSKSCMFFSNVIKFGQYHKNKHRTIFYSTPTEAYEAGIEYILNNLI